MPCLTPWDPEDGVGHPLVDAQHQALLAQCNGLAEHCSGAAAADDAAFDAAFERLRALAREHFDTESALLAAGGDAEAGEHGLEFEEFEYLAAEIATTANFDRLELQRFAALWCLGHVRSSARRLRALRPTAAS